MRRLDRYISKTVIAAMLLVMLVVLGLDSLGRVIDGTKDIRLDYDFTELLIYNALSIPSRIYLFLPFAALVGCLAGLGSLANNSELVVMRAAGVSTFRLIWAVVKPTMLIMFIGVLIGEFVAPETQKIAESRASLKSYGRELTVSASGLWNREGQEYVHFNAVEPGGVLYGVTIYRFDDERRLQSTLFASRASYFSKDRPWLLENVAETVFTGESTHLDQFPTLDWNTQLSPELLKFVMLEAKHLSIRGLWVYAHYLSEQGLSSGEYWLSFWNKALKPLATLSLVLVGMSFVFGPLREVTMGFRIFTGVIVAILFQTLENFLAPASLVFDFAPIYAALTPIILATILGFLMLSRVR